MAEYGKDNSYGLEKEKSLREAEELKDQKINVIETDTNYFNWDFDNYEAKEFRFIEEWSQHAIHQVQHLLTV